MLLVLRLATSRYTGSIYERYSQQAVFVSGSSDFKSSYLDSVAGEDVSSEEDSMRKETKLIVVLSNPVFPHHHQNIVILFFSSL